MRKGFWTSGSGLLRGLLLGLLLSALQGTAAEQGRPKVPKSAPSVGGQVWLDHFQRDLLPFWDLPAAWGTPRGNFPTFRCNDGSLPDPAAPCEALKEAPGWIRAEQQRDYVRMKSRQAYFYGVAFHLTGDPRMLELARDGVRFIRERALEKETGSAITYWEQGAPGPAVLERTSQDLAYAQLGMAMYYYLTRDPEVLSDILRLKDHIFNAYWNPEWGLLRWVAKAGPDQAHLRKELVAQLDQVNAYMLLLTPILPAAEQQLWRQDLERLARVMIRDFHAPEQHLFWGTVHDEKGMLLGSRHTDFGHTAKALWMIERIGRLVKAQDLVDFATREGQVVLKQAYLPESGSWASRLRRDGSVDVNKEWWIYAELDQLAATLALGDPSWAAPLAKTQAYWLRVLVDSKDHEVWGFANGETHQPWPGPKIHHWKSGYHSAEHALVSYLAAQALKGQPARLYFALSDPKAVVLPYFFAGKVRQKRQEALPGFEGRKRLQVRFTGLR